MLGRAFLGLMTGVAALLSVQLGGTPTASAAYAATASQYCTPQGIDVRLEWTGQNPSGGSQYIDLSLGNTWADGTFTTYGPLPGNAVSTVIKSLQPGVTYYMRMAQQQADGKWMGNDSMHFATVPACSYDNSYRQPFLPSPGSELLYPFLVNANAAFWAPGLVQVAAYPQVQNNYYFDWWNWWNFLP